MRRSMRMRCVFLSVVGHGLQAVPTRGGLKARHAKCLPLPGRLFTNLRIVETPFDQPIQSSDLARAANRDKLHLARIARLEANGGAGGDVQAHAVGRGAVEREIAVDLEEMKVRSDLD